MYGCEASHAYFVLVMMNCLNYGWSMLLGPTPSSPSWVSGDVKFGVNEREPQVLFGCSVASLDLAKAFTLKVAGLWA